MDYELLYQLAVLLSMATITFAKGEIARICREANNDIRARDAVIRYLTQQLEECHEELRNS